MEKSFRKYSYLFLGLSILLLLFFAMDLLMGAVLLPAGDVWKALTGGAEVPDYVQAVVMNFRLPKAITALLAGMALSVSGLQMQTTFRNPLADPYVLGISSGSGFGVALFILGTSVWGFSSVLWLHNLGMALAGWIGAFVMLAIVTAASLRLRDTMSMLVMGIMVGGAVSAMVGVLQYFSEATALKTYVIWTMGSFSTINPEQLSLMVPTIILGLLLALMTMKWLNALVFGDVYAQSVGLHVKRARTVILLISGLLAGTVTAFCGPIGFIGIAVPHVSRMLFGTANHRVLMPATMLLGGVVMLMSDIISQLPGTDTVLPVNTITALLGIPVIIYIIFRNQRGF
ncbi:MAG: iron ABC transporter permease [Bacteroidales bacterium]|nr:iron ABC transporter permease [Bacteroidales bacterium]MCL2132978.1 iron ABC transporter permease [Bacteroidales bacterium]